jgi:hypothetical protein
VNQVLRNKIAKAVEKVASGRATINILNAVDKDLILPMLNLTARSKVSATTEGKFIYINVGRRDFEFYVKSGKLAGAGTFLG